MKQEIKKTNKQSFGGLIFGLMGMISVVLGLIKGSTIFSLEFVFGLIALLFSLHLMDDKDINTLKKRIKKLEDKQ